MDELVVVLIGDVLFFMLCVERKHPAEKYIIPSSYNLYVYGTIDDNNNDYNQ